MDYKKGQKVELIELNENKAMTNRYKIGMIGTIYKIDHPGKDYHIIKWENGLQSDSHKSRIKTIN